MVRLDIDLAFSEHEGADADTPPFEGTITAAGTEVRIVVNDPSRLPGNGRRTLTELSTVADALASRGVSVRLEGPDGPILQLGDIKSNALQRVVTGSSHIRLGSVAAVAPLLTRRNKGSALTFPIPPETPLPLVPTINRTVRRRVTTTHYTPGSGRPRLIFAVGDSSWDGSRPREFDLLPTKTVIGSGDEADLRLPGSPRCTPRSVTRATTSTCSTASTRSEAGERESRDRDATAGVASCAPAPGSNSATGDWRTSAPSSPITGVRTAAARAGSSRASASSPRAAARVRSAARATPSDSVAPGPPPAGRPGATAGASAELT